MLRRHLLFFFLLLWLFPSFNAAQAQVEGPYHLSFEREVLYEGVGLLSLGVGELLRTRTRPIFFADLRRRDHSDFDEVAIGLHSSEAAKWSDYTMIASSAISSLFLAKARTRTDFGKITILLSEVMFINGGLTNMSKSLFKRPRPYVFADNWEVDRKLYDGDRAAFVSGHTSGSAAGAFFFARVFSDYYPDSKLKPWVWGVAAGLPALTGYLRIRAGKHYPSDVLAGYILGASVGYLVPTLHKKPLLKKGITLQPTGQGFYLAWQL